MDEEQLYHRIEKLRAERDRLLARNAELEKALADAGAMAREIVALCDARTKEVARERDDTPNPAAPDPAPDAGAVRDRVAELLRTAELLPDGRVAFGRNADVIFSRALALLSKPPRPAPTRP